MNRFLVKWSMGRKTEYETEQSEEQFRVRMFGHPERLPDGVTFQKLEAQDAPEVRKVEEGDLGQHQDRDGGGKTAEAGDRDRHVESRKVEAKKEVAPAKAQAKKAK